MSSNNNTNTDQNAGRSAGNGAVNIGTKSSDPKDLTSQANNQNQGTTPSSAAANLQAQNTIGHYVLGKALGEGTFGKVKLGTHILTGEKVAVKVLEKSRIKDKKDVDRISREIKILKQLHHPNVVQIYEIIETEKDLFLVMEFVQGGELFELIVQNQRLKEKQACKYFQELISGINYIHQLGICHRDLKPENLLIDYDQSMKIVDFGLSNIYEQGSTLKTACGSPCYAAPEMIAGKRYNGLMSDLWSCGVVLFAMLCGYLPYEDKKTEDLYKKILKAQYTLPDFLSEEAKDMIAKIFITEPSERINIDQIRKHPWYQINKPETLSFNVCPPSVQATRPKTINRNGKMCQLIQRPNMLDQKIISNLEVQQGFNRESLLKSIKMNKHNHLTATYYLLLKKHMIRHLKPYCDAFMEYKQIDQVSEYKNHQELGKVPVVQLKSKQVLDAIKSIREEKQSETPIPGSSTNEQSKPMMPQGANQKQFQSIDHNKQIGDKSLQNDTKHHKQQEAKNEAQLKHNYQSSNMDYSDINLQPQLEAQNAMNIDPKQQITIKKYQKDLPIARVNNFYQQPQQQQQKTVKQKSQKSQDSFKNLNGFIDDPTNSKRSGGNRNVNENQLINPYQVKKRAESYNNQRKGYAMDFSLEKLDKIDHFNQFGIKIEGEPNSRRRDNNGGTLSDQDIEYEYIQSKNMKETNKGSDQREIRAPSSGSSGSQPRVQIAGGSTNGDCQNISGAQQSHNQGNRRYDSIEHQRQSQIDKFLQSPQEQIASLLNNKKQNSFNINISNGTDVKRLSKNNRNSLPINQKQTGTNQKSSNTNVMKLNLDKNSKAVGYVNQTNNSTYYKQLQDQLNLLNQQKQYNEVANSSNTKMPTNNNQDSINKRGSQVTSEKNSIEMHSSKNNDKINPQNWYQYDYQNTNEDSIGDNFSNQYSSSTQNVGHEQTSGQRQMNHNGMKGGEYRPSEQTDIELKRKIIKANIQQQQQQQQNGTQSSGKQVHRKAKSMLNHNGINVDEAYQNSQKVQQIKLSDDSIRNIIQQMQTTKAQPPSTVNAAVGTIQQVTSNKLKMKKDSVGGAQIISQISQGNQNNINFMLSGNAAPMMPSAPKSGNVLKLKQQVVRNKQKNMRDRGNSLTLSQQNEQQNTMVKKKQAAHTTKNTSTAQGHAHNFEILEQAKLIFDAQLNAHHMFSVQHPTNPNPGLDSRASPNMQSQVTPDQQYTEKNIVSGQSVSLASNYSQGTKNLSIQNNYQNQIIMNQNKSQQSDVAQRKGNTSSDLNEGYLQNLIREYKNNQNPPGPETVKNLKLVSQPNSSNLPKQSRNTLPVSNQQNQNSGGANSTNLNNRSSIKVQKLQKQQVNQIDNIQKQISQNQKAMQNMTQNLFNKNNTGNINQIYDDQKVQVDQHMQQKYTSKASQNTMIQNEYNQLSESLRGSQRGLGTTGKINIINNNGHQKQKQRRDGNHIQNEAIQTQVKQRLSSQPKSIQSNEIYNNGLASHYQTSDNREQINSDQQKIRLKQHPASTTAAGQHQTNYHSEGCNGHMGNQGCKKCMEDLLQNSQSNSRKQQVGHKRVQSVNPKPQQQQQTSSTKFGQQRQQSLKVKQTYTSSNANQMSMMSKYNQQQHQNNNRNNQQKQSISSVTNAAYKQVTTHNRHYSAPREAIGDYGQINEDEIKRIHLVNQSMDMGQINQIGTNGQITSKIQGTKKVFKNKPDNQTDLDRQHTAYSLAN